MRFFGGFIGFYDRTADGGSITAGGFFAVISQTAVKRRKHLTAWLGGCLAWLGYALNACTPCNAHFDRLRPLWLCLALNIRSNNSPILHICPFYAHFTGYTPRRGRGLCLWLCYNFMQALRHFNLFYAKKVNIFIKK